MFNCNIRYDICEMTMADVARHPGPEVLLPAQRLGGKAAAYFCGSSAEARTLNGQGLKMGG